MTKQILFVCIWLLVASNVLAQSRNTGYFGHRFFVALEGTPIAYKYAQPLYKEYLLENQSFIGIKGSLLIGWQKKINKQWILGGSYVNLPHIGMNSVTTAFGNGIYSKVDNDHSFIAESKAIQFFVLYKKYRNIAPLGLNFGFKLAVNTVGYTYQHTYIEQSYNTNNNTSESTITIYPSKNGNHIYPLLGYNIGHTFLLSRHATMDLGIRLNLLLSNRKIHVNNEMSTSNDIINNIYRINQSSLRSSQLLELYASFSLHY